MKAGMLHRLAFHLKTVLSSIVYYYYYYYYY